jgi:hypothetical protein
MSSFDQDQIQQNQLLRIKIWNDVHVHHLYCTGSYFFVRYKDLLIDTVLTKRHRYAEATALAAKLQVRAYMHRMVKHSGAIMHNIIEYTA